LSNFNGGVAAEFVNEKFKPARWIRLIAGVRQTAFRSSLAENATDARFGIAVKLPQTDWLVRGFYGYYHPAPPLATATGALLGLATSNNLSFAALHSKRDIEWRFGVIVPSHGGTLDTDNVQTKARNWLDRNHIGKSNIFWLITWQAALIQGWELTLCSPSRWHRGQLHLADSNQIVQATSPIPGGLICPAFPFPLARFISLPYTPPSTTTSAAR
jgi:hypothetical protein